MRMGVSDGKDSQKSGGSFGYSRLVSELSPEIASNRVSSHQAEIRIPGLEFRATTHSDTEPSLLVPPCPLRSCTNSSLMNPILALRSPPPAGPPSWT